MPSGAAALSLCSDAANASSTFSASPRDDSDAVSFSRAQPERRTCPPGKSTALKSKTPDVNAGRYSSRNLCPAHKNNPSRRASSLTRAMLPPPPAVPPKPPSDDAGSLSDLQRGVICLTEEAKSPASRRGPRPRASLCTVQGSVVCFVMISWKLIVFLSPSEL